MDLDLQRFYRINRRAVMWVAFFAIVYLLRHFFALIFLTFIFGFVMYKVAMFLTRNTRLPYRISVLLPFLVLLTLLSLLIHYTVPRVTKEGAEFARGLPYHLTSLAIEIRQFAEDNAIQNALLRYVQSSEPQTEQETGSIPFEAIPKEQPDTDVPSEAGGKSTTASTDPTTQAAATTPGAKIESFVRTMREVPPKWDELSSIEKQQVIGLVGEMQRIILSILPGVISENEENLQGVIIDLTGRAVTGSIQFLLGILLSFLILWDFDHVAKDLNMWRDSPVGAFFAEAASSVIDFSRVVGTAFQCQLVIALLNAAITCVGLFILNIHPLVLLTTIVFLFGLIPVLGVFISSVPIILISFNEYGLNHALMTLGMIVVVHMLEAYVFNPRIYAARFHLNPVIVLIILLVAHELAGVWGMLLGIPVTHYVLNIAQMPTTPRRRRLLRVKDARASANDPSESALSSKSDNSPTPDPST